MSFGTAFVEPFAPGVLPPFEQAATVTAPASRVNRAIRRNVDFMGILVAWRLSVCPDSGVARVRAAALLAYAGWSTGEKWGCRVACRPWSLAPSGRRVRHHPPGTRL